MTPNTCSARALEGTAKSKKQLMEESGGGTRKKEKREKFFCFLRNLGSSGRFNINPIFCQLAILKHKTQNPAEISNAQKDEARDYGGSINLKPYTISSNFFERAHIFISPKSPRSYLARYQNPLTTHSHP